MQWKIRPWRLLIFSLFFAIVVLYLSTRTLNGLSSEKRRFSFSAWLQGEVLGVSYEDRYCKDLNNDKNSKYPPVNEVAKQLNIKDGETVFSHYLSTAQKTPKKLISNYPTKHT